MSIENVLERLATALETNNALLTKDISLREAVLKQVESAAAAAAPKAEAKPAPKAEPAGDEAPTAEPKRRKSARAPKAAQEQTEKVTLDEMRAALAAFMKVDDEDERNERTAVVVALFEDLSTPEHRIKNAKMVPESLWGTVLRYAKMASANPDAAKSWVERRSEGKGIDFETYMVGEPETASAGDDDSGDDLI